MRAEYWSERFSKWWNRHGVKLAENARATEIPAYNTYRTAYLAGWSAGRSAKMKSRRPAEQQTSQRTEGPK